MDIEGGETLVFPSISDFLIDKEISLFVSFHPFWFKDIREDSFRIIEHIIKFPGIYDCLGNPMSIEILKKTLLSRKGVDVRVSPIRD
jgi:hypothetical protein